MGFPSRPKSPQRFSALFDKSLNKSHIRVTTALGERPRTVGFLIMQEALGMAVDELRRETQIIGNYDLLEKVAEGGMGTVYKGRNRTTGEIVAVKVVPPHIASNRVYLKRFEKEYNASRALNHPNIVRALDFGWSGDAPFLVMEFVEGESLGQRLERDHHLGEEEAVRIVAQVAEGLDIAHAMGLVHRDVKPDNILLTSDGTAKLTDLGLVKDPDVDMNLTRTGRGLGTPHFMAPEQFRNAKHADARCDIYSLGATMYMMVTGELPFQSNGPLEAWMKKVRNDIAPPIELAKDLSMRANRAIRQAMSVDPLQRPASCREFVENLQPPRDGKVTPIADEIEPASVTLWHVLYSDAEGVIHITQETSNGVRRVLKDGSLGDPYQLRLAPSLLGPFQPPAHFDRFRDVLSAPPEEPADAPFAIEADNQSAKAPHIDLTAPATSNTSRAAPLIYLGAANRSVDWLAWLTLAVLGLAAAVIGYSVIPGLRWRWF